VSTLRWEWIAAGYFAYLFVAALSVRRFARARGPTLAATAACCAVIGAQATSWLGSRIDAIVLAMVVPFPVLLAGYWISGLFFTAPMPRVERWLMAVDERLLRRTGILAAYEGGHRLVREFFETAYLLVYPVIPAALATLAIGGHRDVLPRFWTIVLLAEFVSYGAMPWLQTRPPRVLESASGTNGSRSMVRRFNAAILDRGSIQANTVPSGHAAGAVATALVVADAMPLAGIGFLVLALSIVAATVLGRYHYVVDSVLGIAVAVSAWALCR
jgi:hypothetical protein